MLNCQPESMLDISSDEENDQHDWYIFGNTQSQTVTDDDDSSGGNVQLSYSSNGIHEENGTELSTNPVN
jgi:hypothetical protein